MKLRQGHVRHASESYYVRTTSYKICPTTQHPVKPMAVARRELEETMRMKEITGSQILKLRLRLGLNQHAFWDALGLTQSGGCRYELGQKIPRSTQILVYLVYGKHPKRMLK